MIDLFPFQDVGSRWLASKRMALLADEMRLGKSAQAIRACDLISAQKILVVCPATARENWWREFKKFSATQIMPYIISYDGLIKRYERLNAMKWDVLICDESHFLKEPTAKRTAAVFGPQGVARSANRTWLLSGTPAPNNAAELWVLLHVSGRTTLGFEPFVSEFCVSHDVGNFRRQIVGTKTDKISEIQKMLKPLLLRRTKAQVLPELPAMLYGDMVVEPGNLELPEETRERLELEKANAVEALGIMDFALDESKSDRELLSTLEGLAQSVSTLRRYLGIQKAIGASMRIVQEMEDMEYEKVVIFAIHQEAIRIIKAHFPDAAMITGKTPGPRRQAEIDRFQNDKNCTVFIGNIKAAGTAINLSAADNIVFIEQDWVPGNNAQAAERCNNMQREDSVFVRYVSLYGNSLDHRITSVLQRKSAELAQIFDA